jgi:glycosyltransferase involved in cell wall biosynthesis
VAPTPFGAGGLFGGGERYPLELARALATSVDTELVTFGPSAGLFPDPQGGGLRIRVLRAVTRLGGHPAHPVAPALPARAVLGGADIIHTHHLWSAPSQAAIVAGRAAGKRIAVTDHGLPPAGLGRRLPGLVHRFLTVSRYSADVLGVPAARTSVIYGGADPGRFRPDAEARRAGVLFVGRITPHKGLDRLIEALPEGASLTCAGTFGHDLHPPESGYPDRLRRAAAGRDVRVTFAEAVADDELPVLYRQARVFVLPSVQQNCYGRRVAVSELLGLSVLEAMASGTPVVCSRLGGLPEIVADGETGYLVEPGDVAGLRARLEELLADPARAERMGRAARESVLARFTWQACAERCLAAYADLTGAA